MNVRRLMILAILLMLTIFMAVRCIGGRGGDPLTSVQQLTEQSDLVVRGDVGRLRGTEIDDAGDNPTAGPSVAFFDFDIDEVLAGSGGTGTIVFAWPDLATNEMAGFSPIEQGDGLVLFLAKPTPDEAPGIDSETGFYVPLAADYAVFDVDGSQVVARSPKVTKLLMKPGDDDPEPTIVDDRLTVPYDVFADVVRRSAS
jgi:hypothetical protein